MENNNSEIDLELDETIAEGNYANLAIISHSSSEFILDFAALLPGLSKAKVRNRVILAPEHAKRLLLSLKDNITKYESNVGPIDIGMRSNDITEGESILGFNIGEA